MALSFYSWPRPPLCPSVFHVYICVHCECACLRERTEHPPFWFSLPGNFTRWRLWVTDWGCNVRGRLTVWCRTLMPSCHSQMCVCVCERAHSATPQSQYVNTYMAFPRFPRCSVVFRLGLTLCVVRQWKTCFVLESQHAICKCMDRKLNLRLDCE